jgi:tetratricopeptide (TPR) repeat protein
MLELNGNNLLLFASESLSTAAEIRERFEATARLCEELRTDRSAAYTTFNRGASELLLGDARKALEYTQAALSTRERLNDGLLIARATNYHSAALLLLGQTSNALDTAEKAVELARPFDQRTRASAAMALGCALCASGDYDRGLSVLAEAMELSRADLPARVVEFLSQFLILVLEAGRTDDGIVIALELREVYDRYDTEFWPRHRSRVLYALALAARAAGDEDEATSLAEKGRAILARDIQRLGEETRSSLEALPFNRGLLNDFHRTGNTPDRDSFSARR